MIGIYGGAFDPPHKEHIRIASEIRREFSLDSVLFLPSGCSPHKELATPFDLRVAMLREAIEGEDLRIDESERDYPDRAYTYKMIPILQEKYGEIAFIIGGDSLLHFDRWMCPDRILALCPIIVVPRGDEDMDTLKGCADDYVSRWGGKISLSSHVRGEAVSSTIVRTKISLGLPTPEIPDKVRDIIVAAGLYEDRKEMVKGVKAALTEKRWMHTCGVVLAGLKINEKVGLPEGKVITACLLHDCMKYAIDPLPGVPEDVVGTKVMHAFNGAEEARRRYGVTDEEVIDAIRYHTTGRRDMTLLDKLVYTADMVEENRTFDGVEELRDLAYHDLDAGFAECMSRTYARLRERGVPIYYLTLDCYEQYCIGG